MKCAPFVFLALVLTVAPVFAGEYVVFSSGLKMRVERHEESGGVIRVFHNGGVLELPATLVSGFELEEVEETRQTAAPPPPNIPQPARDPRTLVREAAERSGLPPEFVASVAQVESGFRPDALSPKGAIGVMQLMPGTAQALGADPRDTAQNIDAGTRLLRELLLKYDGDVVKALAAYNAGEAAVERYHGLPPYNETRWYVKKVIDGYRKPAP